MEIGGLMYSSTPAQLHRGQILQDCLEDCDDNFQEHGPVKQNITSFLDYFIINGYIIYVFRF